MSQNIPRDLIIFAIQSIVDDMKVCHAREEELSYRLRHIQEEYKKEIYEFLGPKSNEYETFYEKRREAVRTMKAQFTRTSEVLKLETEFRKKRVEEIDQFFKNLGINISDIKSIRKKYSEEFRVAIEKSVKSTNSKGEDQ